MDPFSAAFLTTLAGKLTGNVAASLTGPLKRQIAGTPAQQAVERSPVSYTHLTLPTSDLV
mgnify:CR=1 FL=1